MELPLFYCFFFEQSKFTWVNGAGLGFNEFDVHRSGCRKNGSAGTNFVFLSTGEAGGTAIFGRRGHRRGAVHFAAESSGRADGDAA